MTLKQACHRLTMVRKKAAAAKEEIIRLNKIIAQLGGHPDLKKRRRRNREIFRQYKKGYSFVAIANQMRMSTTRISQICRELEWTAEKEAKAKGNPKQE